MDIRQLRTCGWFGISEDSFEIVVHVIDIISICQSSEKGRQGERGHLVYGPPQRRIIDIRLRLRSQNTMFLSSKSNTWITVEQFAYFILFWFLNPLSFTFSVELDTLYAGSTYKCGEKIQQNKYSSLHWETSYINEVYNIRGYMVCLVIT